MIKAKKSLGQNFLIDKNIIEKITNVVNIKNRIILEVGPGTGNLTFSILNQKPKKIFVVEKDNELALQLKNNFIDQITIFNEDILKFFTFEKIFLVEQPKFGLITRTFLLSNADIQLIELFDFNT